ncbi:MAG TPA: dephospho-CoA kinase [Candidatus Eremiobacteraceae bacterium]|nr:dephospho-CoA kinase [Candidatus Eremiobacteraceae bacterium]
MIVGLTGGIGSGKSVVAGMLAKAGAVIVDTDALAREVVEPPSPTLEKIRAEFGPAAIALDGRLDRDAVAKIVFSDEQKRRRLNELTHPEILKRALAEIGRYPSSTIVVVVVPLLFESGFERNCDRIIAVLAPEAMRLARVVQRDGSDSADVRARMRAQLPDGAYAAAGAILIHNTGSVEDLRAGVDAAWRELTAAQSR